MGNSTDTTDLPPDFVYAMGDLTQASSYLNSSLSAFIIVARKVEQRWKDLEEKEAYLKDMERGVSEKLLQLQEAEIAWEQKEERMRAQEREWEEKRIRWREMEQRMEASIAMLEQQVHLNVEKKERKKDSAEEIEVEKRIEAGIAQLDQPIHMNVGGKRFTTTKETLLQFKNSFFDYMLNSGNTMKDKNGEFFIDHDPKYFSVLLNYLREGKLRVSEKIDIEKLQDEFEFYRIQVPLSLMEIRVETPRSRSRSYTPSPTPVLKDSPRQQVQQLFEGGNLLTADHKLIVSEWLPSRRFELVYKASQDGFLHSDFHGNCDMKGPTLTIILSTNGYIFGGFTSQSWESLKIYKPDPTAFLFTLTNPHAIPPTPYALRASEAHHAIYCHRSHCAVFGYGCDIYVSPDSHSNSNSFTRFPYSFIDTTGKGNATFTGERNFITSEVEVYTVI